MDAAVRVPFVDLKAQFAVIRGEIEAALSQVLEDTSFILGPQVAQFEHAFASFVGVKHVVGVANGTDALLLALRALGTGRGDEVIIPANTFAATAEAIAHAGARPVLVDIDPHTYNIDVNQIERCITPSTRAIIPVHLYGQPADLAPVLEIAERHGCQVVEDAAQAHGATYRGRRVGSFGRAGCFSFYPAKNLGAYGDAGAVATNDDRLARAVRQIHNHGGSDKYRHDLVGYNSRLDTVLAAVLLVKLKYLDRWNQRRRDHAHLYNELLGKIPGIVTPAAPDGLEHVYHLYVVRVERGKRDDLREYLRQRGIQTGIHYPAPVHLLPAFDYLGNRQGDFPVAEQSALSILSLPMYAEVTSEQIRYVAGHVADFMAARVATSPAGAGVARRP